MYISKKTREIIKNKFGGRCAYCGIQFPFKDLQIDHIIPQRNFVSGIKNNWRIPEFLKHLTVDDVNHNDNLFPACRVCNGWKTSEAIELFRSEITEQVNRLRKNSSNYRMAEKYNLVKETDNPVVFYFETVNKPINK